MTFSQSQSVTLVIWRYAGTNHTEIRTAKASLEPDGAVSIARYSRQKAMKISPSPKHLKKISSKEISGVYVMAVQPQPRGTRHARSDHTGKRVREKRGNLI